TCCASGWASPARSTRASRASAARARSTWTGCWPAPAWWRRARPRAGTCAPSRAWPPAASCPPCSGPSFRRARCSAASARPGCWSPRTTSSSGSPHRATPRSGRRWPATCAGAPGTRRSWKRSAWRRPGGLALESDPMTAPTTPAGTSPGRTTPVSGGVGSRAGRPDGTPKVTGEFVYSSDLWLDGMIWGVTLRSPHPYAGIRSIETAEALAMPGVSAVLTQEDVPGKKLYGLEITDQPVLASGVVRYQGEPVALVAAGHPEIARQAAKRIRVDYEVYEPVTDAHEALGHPRWNLVHSTPGKVSELSRERAQLHPAGNLVRHLKLRKGDPDPVADVVVTGEYQVGMQDQAFLGPESGLAVPS